MKIRKAEKADALNLAAMGLCVWIDTYATEGVRESLARYSLSEFTECKFLELIKARRVYIIEDDHALGYAVIAAREDAVEIETFYVLPRFQGWGYGRKLMEYLKQLYPSLWLSCWCKNEQALAFYTANGFLKTGETEFTLDGESYKNFVLSY